MVLAGITCLCTGSCTCSKEEPTPIPPPEGIDAEISTIYSERNHPGSPTIENNVVVFSENGDIYGFDLTKEKIFPICENEGEQEYPSISGDNVIWIDHRDGAYAYDIYGYDLSSSTEHYFTSVMTPSGPWRGPDIDGDIIVWEDDQEGNWEKNGYDISGYNIETDEEFSICSDSSQQACPQVSGNIVVWTDSRNGNGDIYGFDLSTNTEFPICTKGGYQGWPDIFGSIVVWEDKRNGNSDIYGYDLSTKTEFPICTEPHDQIKPMVNEDTVVWEDERHSWWEEELNYWFYGYELSSKSEFPIIRYDAIFGMALQGFSDNTIVYYDMGGENWKIMGVKVQ